MKLPKEAKINRYLFFDDKGVLGVSQGYSVSNAFFNLFGTSYTLKSSRRIFYRILERFENV